MIGFWFYLYHSNSSMLSFSTIFPLVYLLGLM